MLSAQSREVAILEHEAFQGGWNAHIAQSTPSLRTYYHSSVFL